MRAALRQYRQFVGAKSLEWSAATGGAGRLFGTSKRG
jgi:hypothetical protein